eukprot:gene2340-2379_t
MEPTYVHAGYIRRLWSADLPLFREHLIRLDTESRHARFGMAVSDEFLKDYAEHCFAINGITFGYFVDGMIRGAGEFRPMFEIYEIKANRTAEAAFSVEKDWRRKGVGTELLARIIHSARNRQADELFMSCLASNRAMQKLALHFKAEITFEADQTTGKLIGRPPTPFSIMQEVFEDSASYATAFLDLQKRLFAAATKDAA